MKQYLDILPPEILYIIISYLPLTWDYDNISTICSPYFMKVYYTLLIDRELPYLADITHRRLIITPCTCYNYQPLRDWKKTHNGRQTPPFGNGPCLASETKCVTKQLANSRRTWPGRFVF